MTRSGDRLAGDDDGPADPGGAHIGGVAPGDTATVTLEKGPDGLYGVRMLMRAE